MSERTTEEIIKDLAPAYLGWKSNEKEKDKLRKEFFAAATKELEAGDLAQETISVIGFSNEEAAQSWVEKQHPKYRVIESRSTEDGWEFIIEEDPAYKDYLIEFADKVWGRQVASGSIFVDDDRMAEDNADLYAEVTEYENQKLIYEICAFCDETNAHELMTMYCEENLVNRVLKDFDDLTPNQLAAIQEYVYEGKPVVKLPAPKKAEDG